MRVTRGRSAHWRGLGLLLVLAGAATSACGQDVRLITPFFDELRQRELFGVAERYAMDRRSELPAESAESVQLAVELSRTFAEHARRVVDAEEQAFLQQRAEEALVGYQNAVRTPRLEAITLEQAYRQVERAESEWWAWTADPDDKLVRRKAIELFRGARTALDNWIAARTQLKPAGAAANRDEDELTSRELALMRRDAEMQLVRLLLTSAELVESGSERVKLLQSAENEMQRLRSSPERGTTATLRNFSIRMARLKNDENQLKSLLRQANADRTAGSIRQAAVAEAVRFELDQRRFDAAAKLLLDAKATDGQVSDRLRALHVEAVLGIRKSAAGQQAELLKTAEEEQSRVTGPWRLRNEFLLQQARDQEAFGDAAEPIVRRGRREFRAGRREDAIASFGDAAEVATHAAGQAELRFMQASLLVETGRFEEAIVACEKASGGAVTGDLAAKASLLAAYCRGRIFATGQKPSARDEYKRALVEHLASFRGDPTAGEAAWMLGTLAEQEGRPAAVVAADRQIPPGHPRSGEASARTARIVERVLSEIRSAKADSVDGRPATEWMRDAEAVIKQLMSNLTRPRREVPLDAAQQGLLAARLMLSMTGPAYDEILAILDRIDSSTDLAEAKAWPEVRQQAAALRLVCLTGSGRYADAAAILERLRSISTAELLDVLRQLARSGAQLEGAARTELAKLELATIARIRLQGGKLSEADRLTLEECEAEALRMSGRFEEAARLLADAAVSKPELAPKLAEALERTGSRTDLIKARDLWKLEEAKQKQGTTAWFVARLRLAECLFKLGQTAEGRKLIQSTRLVYPELGSSELRAGFEAVEKAAVAPSR